MLRTLIIALIAFGCTLPAKAQTQDADTLESQIIDDANRSREEQTNAATTDLSVLQTVDTPASGVDIEGDSAFTIGAVEISGSKALAPAEFSDVVESFIGRTANNADLRALAQAIAGRARDRGYLFASAIIPAQGVQLGIVRVVLDDGVIDQVQVTGTDNAHVIKLLRSLEGRAGRTREVERAILLAEDVPGIKVVRTGFRRSGGRGVLAVTIKEFPYRVDLTADNYGTNRAGPVRARLEVDYAGLFDESDRLYTQVLTTPAEPDELTFVSARYSNIVDARGTELTLIGAAGRTHRTRAATGYDARGRSRFVALKAASPLLRSSDASLWLSAEGALLDFQQTFTQFPQENDRIATLTLSASGNAKLLSGRLSGGVALVQGLDILGATRANDPLSSRPDGSGEFTKGEIWVNWLRNLGGGFSLRTAASGQIASRPLLSSQEIDFGGPRFGRGFDFSEASGDQGVLGLTELRHYFDAPVKGIDWLQLYTYADGGHVSNLRGGFGDGTLASAGGGFRSGIGKLEMAFEIAVPVRGERSNGDTRSPQINAAIGFSF